MFRRHHRVEHLVSISSSGRDQLQTTRLRSGVLEMCGRRRWRRGGVVALLEINDTKVGYFVSQ